MEVEKKKNLDLDFYETVIAYNSLTSSSYLASIIDSLETRFFKNKDIKNIVSIIIKFFQERGNVPTHTEIKTYLVNDELKQSFKNVVTSFVDMDKKFDKNELVENVS